MSKIGKQIITLPTGVTLNVASGVATVTGPKGTLTLSIPSSITVKIEGEIVTVTREDDTKRVKSLHGTIRSLLSNMVLGVSKGWVKQLELIGTGFRAEVAGNTLTLIVGYSHPVKLEAPAGVTFKVEKNVVTVEGVDKEAVGQIAAEIRAVRKPEPYKGKGIKYTDEIVRRKPGKAAAKTTGA